MNRVHYRVDDVERGGGGGNDDDDDDVVSEPPARSVMGEGTARVKNVEVYRTNSTFDMHQNVTICSQALLRARRSVLEAGRSLRLAEELLSWEDARISDASAKAAAEFLAPKKVTTTSPDTFTATTGTSRKKDKKITELRRLVLVAQTRARWLNAPTGGTHSGGRAERHHQPNDGHEGRRAAKKKGREEVKDKRYPL